MTEIQIGNIQSGESNRFLESYMDTPDILDRINLAKNQFESNTDAWILTYYANANRLPQTTLEANTKVLTNQKEHQESTSLTDGQIIFKELNQYQLYHDWLQELAKKNDDQETKKSVSRVLEMTKNIVHLHFHYDDLNPENKQVIDWLIAKTESDDVSILTSVGSTTQEYTDFVNSLARTYKSPLFIISQKDVMKPQMFVFPDLFDKSMTEFDLLTHLAHERAHDIYFQVEPPPSTDDETNTQKYLVFHEYLAILESQRSYQNLGSIYQKGLSEGKRKFFADNSIGVSFEMPGYQDQITTELNPDTFALYYAYKHALETKITAHMNLVLAAIQQGEVEKAKKMLETIPGSLPPVGDFKPIKN